MNDVDDGRNSVSEEPLPSREQLSIYVPPPPPSDMVERIMAAVDAERSATGQSAPAARHRSRWAAVPLAAGALAAAVVLLIVLWPSPRRLEGEVVARAPQRLAIGSRAEALLDEGASITYVVEPDGQCRVVQHVGDVQYQVSEGGDFVVETPAGRVSVLGTHFSVEVEEMRASLGKKAAFVAAGGVLVTVALYEGHLLFENEHGRVALAEGDIATARAGEAPSIRPLASTAPDLRAPTSRVRRFKSRAAREALRAAIEAARREERERESSDGRRPDAPQNAAPSGEGQPYGTHTREYIRETVHEIVPLIQECYEVTLAQAPNAAGHVVVRFNIVGEEDVGGLVETAEIVDIDERFEALPDFNECIVQTILSIEVDPPEGGGEVNVTYPFFFNLADEEDTPEAQTEEQ